MFSAGTGLEPAIIGGIVSAVGSIASAGISAATAPDGGGVDKTSKMGGGNKDQWAEIGSAVNKQPQARPRIQANLPEFNAPDVSTGELGMPYKLTGVQPMKTRPRLNWR